MASLTNRLNSSLAQCRSGCHCSRCPGSFGFSPKRTVAPRSSTVRVRASAQEVAQKKIDMLLANNRKWAASQVKYDPSFFSRLKDQQKPDYLWIGCADSRVPANVIVGLDPGEVFVQRNVGNQASHTDMNVQACIEFSVKALGVTTIILCGHYNCGAVKASLTLPSKTQGAVGLTNCWISDIREARNQNMKALMGLSEKEQVEKMCEFNVLRQVFHVCTSPTVQEAWDSGKKLSVYGMCYSLEDGLLKPLVGPLMSNEMIGDDQDEFVSDSMKKQEAGLLDIIFGTGKEAPAAATPKKKDQVTANVELISKRLSQHAAWDKGAN